MRVLVTGASGFIAGHVCEALRKAGHQVVGLDISFSPNVHIVADITKPIPSVGQVDAVIHLAALSHPRDCEGAPAKAFSVNVNGIHQVLRAAVASSARKFIFASSAHVYGIPPKYLPTDENHPLRLQNDYTITKILGEELCRLYYENHGLNYTVLRLYNTYGPGQQSGYFIPDMLEKAAHGHIDISWANTTKDFVYISDVVDAFLRALESPFAGALNVATAVETELAAIGQIIAESTGASFSFTKSKDASRMCGDYRHAARILGWQPKVTLAEGMRAVLDDAKIRSVA